MASGQPIAYASNFEPPSTSDTDCIPQRRRRIRGEFQGQRGSQFHFTELNKRLDVRVLGYVGHNGRGVRLEGFLKCLG